MMKKFKGILVVLFLSLGIISCSDEEEVYSTTGPGFSISEMAGTWEAVEAGFIPAGPHEPEDQVGLILEGGSLSMVIQSNGRFTINIAPFDRDPYTYTGRMFFEAGESFAMEFDKYPGDYDYWYVRLTETTLELNGGETAGEYDFDNDGTFEPAAVFLKLERV